MEIAYIFHFKSTMGYLVNGEPVRHSKMCIVFARVIQCLIWWHPERNSGKDGLFLMYMNASTFAKTVSKNDKHAERISIPQSAEVKMIAWQKIKCES